MWQFLDSCISPLFLIFGIFGNLFMLSIVLRWIMKYHVNVNFCPLQTQLVVKKTNPSRPKINTKLAVERSSILNPPMCIYLAFLSIADIGFLITSIIRNGLRAADTTDKYLLPLDISNAFKGTSWIEEQDDISIYNNQLVFSLTYSSFNLSFFLRCIGYDSYPYGM